MTATLPDIIPGIKDPATGEPYRMPPIVEWDDWFKAQERCQHRGPCTKTNGPHRWNDDEHYTLIGTTGCGKTTLARELLELREYVALLATKPRDESLDRFINDPRYTTMREWKDLPITGKRAAKRRLIWPRMEDLNNDQAWQKYYIEAGLDEMFTQGGWNIYLDEVRYISSELGLRNKLNLYLLQYRALGGSLLAGTQRPSWIPREFYSQCQHMCLWHQGDDYDLQRIAGIGSLNTRYIRHVVTRLSRHEFLYLHTPTGYVCISEAPNPKGR